MLRLSGSFRLLYVGRPFRRCFSCSRSPLFREPDLRSPQSADYQSKYADKLRKRAEDQGSSVPDLLNQIKEREREKRRQWLAQEAQQTTASAESQTDAFPKSSPSSSINAKSRPSVRKDSSPVKPLNSIINLDRLLSSPHTAEQLSTLWRAYHSSRSGGTGRGFLSASVPVDTYQKMVDVSTRYPTFVIPIPRPKPEDADSDGKPAYEFYFMEWTFHGSPPEPSTKDNLFKPPQPSSNPQTSTILFTPLQEYKLRGSFATPYVVVTHYTDLAKSHGLVLLRGEITPSANAPAPVAADGDGRYMLSQHDAQLLAIAVQRFYLRNEEQNERLELLRAFHEKPSEFNWEDILKHVEYSL